MTEATDSGLWEEGIVKERTMEGGRGPRRSSAAGCHSAERREEQTTQEEVSASFSCWRSLVLHFLAEQFNMESQRLPKYNSGRQVAPFFQYVFSTFLHNPVKYVNQQNQNRV